MSCTLYQPEETGSGYWNALLLTPLVAREMFFAFPVFTVCNGHFPRRCLPPILFWGDPCKSFFLSVLGFMSVLETETLAKVLVFLKFYVSFGNWFNFGNSFKNLEVGTARNVCLCVCDRDTLCLPFLWISLFSLPDVFVSGFCFCSAMPVWWQTLLRMIISGPCPLPQSQCKFSQCPPW